MNNIESEVMEFGNKNECFVPNVGDYIEMTAQTQSHYSISWWCSEVIAITPDGGCRMYYDGGNKIYYIQL